jgi:hypothetical protein
MTNGTFTTDSGPMQKEAEGPEAYVSSEGGVHKMVSEEDLARRDVSTFEFLKNHPVLIAMGLGLTGLALGAAPATVGVAGAEVAAYVGGFMWNGGVVGLAGRAVGDVTDRVVPGMGPLADFGAQMGLGVY